jgi:multidrug transporter EmrE-like cation transporter
MNATEPRTIDHVWIAVSILFTACSQLLIKWQVGEAGPLPVGGDRLQYFVDLFMRPWIVVALGSTFLAGVTWMVALGKFELSYAFPFYALNFIIVFFASAMLFSEPLSPAKLMGLALIVAGVAVLGFGSR